VLTARMRLTLFYAGLFVVSGAGLLAITYALMGGQASLGFYDLGNPGHLSGPGSAHTVSQGGSELSPQQVIELSAVALAIMAVASVALGWIAAGRVLRPVRNITATAREISARNLHERIGINGPNDEFKELGETLDDLLGRLEASFESQRRFVASASHELRTPLAVERTLLQVALADPAVTIATLRSACERVLASGRQTEQLIESLLTLASSERGIEHRLPVDLAEITAAVITSLGGAAVRSSLAPAPATGDPHLIESLVVNLLSNALRHNNATGAWVSVSTGVRAESAFVAVSNSGPRVPAEALERLFQPFQRLDGQRTRRPGHGLGLAIVRAIATAHGAVINASPRPAGGLDIEVRFTPR